MVFAIKICALFLLFSGCFPEMPDYHPNPAAGARTFQKAEKPEYKEALPSRGGYFLALGTDRFSNGAAFYSRNGTSWQQIRHHLLDGHSPFSVCTMSNIIHVGFSDGTILQAPRWRIVKRGGFDLKDTCFGKDVYVAVGKSGSGFIGAATIVWSHDCKNWHSLIFAARELHAVAFGNGTFVAVGEKGTCLTSNNGIHWTIRAPISRQHLLSIVFFGGDFHAAGPRGIQYRSRDGITWAKVTVDGGDSRWLNLAIGKKRIIAARYLKPAALMNTTSSGLVFKEAGMNAPILNAVTYGNGLYVGCGQQGLFSWSTDGLDWHTIQIGNENLNTIAFGANTFVAGGAGGSIRTSKDGKIWREILEPFSTPLHKIIFTGSRFLAVGKNGRHLWSKDGQRWYDDTCESFGVFALTHVNGLLMAAGQNGRRALLTRGKTQWETIPGFSTCNIHGLIYAQNKFVATASSWFGIKGQHLWSIDGKSWNASDLRNGGFGSLAFGNKHFIAAGDNGELHTSVDGVSWHSRKMVDRWHTIAFLGGRFLAFSHNRRIFLSTNGSYWKSHPMPAGEEFFAVGYGKGLFVAGGDNSHIATSRDGINWKITRLPLVKGWGGSSIITVHRIQYIPE